MKWPSVEAVMRPMKESLWMNWACVRQLLMYVPFARRVKPLSVDGE